MIHELGPELAVDAVVGYLTLKLSPQYSLSKCGETSEVEICFPEYVFMSRVLPRDLHEAEQLLQELRSWTDEEIEELPKFYSEKAREYRRLTNTGEE